MNAGDQSPTKTPPTASQPAQPIVDVVIPVRNGATTVERAIRSVLAQELDDLRLTVVDDGSTDNTMELLSGIVDDRLTVVQQDPAGVAAARNAGASHGSAPWIAFLDADDEVTPDWLGLLTQSDSAEVARCGAIVRSGDGSETRLAGAEGGLLAGRFAVRRELFEAVAGYDTRFEFSENTDLDIRLRAEIKGVPEALRVVDAEPVIIHRSTTARASKFGHTVLRDGAELLLSEHSDKLGRQAKSSFSAVAGVNNLALGEQHRARPYLWTACRLQPLKLRYWIRLFQTWVPRRPQDHD